MASLASHFLAQARNNHWSNHRLYSACAKLSAEDYFAEREAFFGSIHATLNHIVIVDLLYLGRMTGSELVALDCEELHADFDSLRQAQYRTDHKLLDYCATLDDAGLDSQVTFLRADNNTYTERIGQLLSHLFIHQVHHRGQVHGMLSATSVDPPQLDEFFLEGDLPLRRQELEELDLPL